MKFAFFSTKLCWTKLFSGRLETHRIAMSMARQPFVGCARGWLVSAVFWSWIEKCSDFPDRYGNEKRNVHAHSIHTHLQHFQSARPHALSSVSKISLTHFDKPPPLLVRLDVPPLLLSHWKNNTNFPNNSHDRQFFVHVWYNFSTWSSP